MPRSRTHLLASLALVALLGCPPRGGDPVAPPAGGAPTPANDEGGPKPDARPRYDARTFHESLAVLGASFSHDEDEILVSTDKTGLLGIYAIPVAGGEPRSLAASPDANLRAVSTFPADDRFLYLADKGGDELDHLFVAEAGKAAKDLTPGDRLKADFAGWSRDHAAFYATTNERDPRFFDLYRYDATTYARALVFQNDAGYAIDAVDPTGRYVAVTETHDNRDSDVLLFELGKGKKPKKIAVSTGKAPAAETAMTFSADGEVLYYSTDAHGEFAEVWGYDLKTRKHALALKADWDVVYFGFSEGGKYRVAAINDDARTRLEVIEVASGQPVALPELPAGEITGVTFSRSETKVAFYVVSDRNTPDLHVVDLASGVHRRLTETLNPAIDPNELVLSEVVRFKSYDGVEVPAILYKPRGAAADAKAPVMLWMHGGPGGQTRRGYSASIQHLVNHGYAVFAVNNRGSSGYGKTFFHLDDRGHGDVDLGDCVAARDHLRTLEWVDGARIGIAGGSYGGYLVLAALAFKPDAFAVGVDLFGVANWIRTLESIPPWWASFKGRLYSELGDPAVDRARLEATSPLLHADKIQRPLLVIQGANDPRVLKVESDEIVAVLEKNKVPVEYVVFGDEGHGFRKRDNRIAADEAMVRFLDQFLVAK